MNVYQLQFEVAETETGHRLLKPTGARGPPARAASVRRNGQPVRPTMPNRAARRSPYSDPPPNQNAHPSRQMSAFSRRGAEPPGVREGSSSGHPLLEPTAWTKIST